MVNVGLIDWGIWLVYLILIFLILFFYRSSRQESYYKYFLPAFLFKVLGGLAFAMVYLYYYGGGDSIEYFNNSAVLARALLNEPASFFELISSEHGQLPANLASYVDQMPYSRGQEEWYMVRALSFFNVLGFNSYIVTTLLLSLASFLGGWKLFLVFADRV
ncbi:hypothetical protein JYT21_00255, partial [bacterium AH-315-B15]|nr:hypothetical protein [bacterium AH-315-B15]